MIRGVSIHSPLRDSSKPELMHKPDAHVVQNESSQVAETFSTQPFVHCYTVERIGKIVMSRTERKHSQQSLTSRRSYLKIWESLVFVSPENMPSLLCDTYPPACYSLLCSSQTVVSAQTYKKVRPTSRSTMYIAHNANSPLFITRPVVWRKLR